MGAAVHRRDGLRGPVPDPGTRSGARGPSRPVRRAGPSAATAALAVGVGVLAGAGTAAANDWLPIFRTEEVAAIGLDSADLVALPDLEAYGTVVMTGDDDLRPVPDAATAEAESGLDVPEVDALPSGITGEPEYQVGGEVTATFTFDADRAAQAAAEAGETLPTPPAGLDGASVRLVAGPGVAQVWQSGSGAPGLIVGRAVAPSAFSSGPSYPPALACRRPHRPRYRSGSARPEPDSREGSGMGIHSGDHLSRGAGQGEIEPCWCSAARVVHHYHATGAGSIGGSGVGSRHHHRSDEGIRLTSDCFQCGPDRLADVLGRHDHVDRGLSHHDWILTCFPFGPRKHCPCCAPRPGRGTRP